MVDTDRDESFEPDQRVHYYYDASWRLLERRIDSEYTDDWSDDGEFTSDPGDIETHQYIWGTNYIDELIYYQRDLNTNGNFNDDSAGRHYVLRDRNYSVIGVTTGTSLERIRYTPYGESQVQIAADVTGEGVIDVDDLNRILAAFGESITDDPTDYTVEADINRDGVVDIDDLNIVIGAPTSSVPENTVGYNCGNIVGYAGYIYEEEIGMYLVRHRWYMPNNGRWATRDPLGMLRTSFFVRLNKVSSSNNPIVFHELFRAPIPRLQYSNGTSLFQYAESRPVVARDPQGTDVWIEGRSGDEPIGHLSICVGDPNGNHRCYGFGATGCTLFGGLRGEVYIDSEGCGKILKDYYIKVNDKDLDEAVREVLDSYLGSKDGKGAYRLVTANCRTFAFQEFDSILEAFEYAKKHDLVENDAWDRTSPPARTGTPPSRSPKNILTTSSQCSSSCSSTTTTTTTTSSGGGSG